MTGKRLNAITPTLLEDAQRDLFKVRYTQEKTRGAAQPVVQSFSKQTVLHYLKFLRHVLNLAVRDGKLERNPFDQVDLPKVTIGRTRFLEPDEEEKVLKELGPVYGNWARLSILTGMRKSEQCRMRWEDVDLKRGLITLPVTKADELQYVELCDEANHILAGMKAIAEAEATANNRPLSPWVFPSKKLTTHIDPRNFYSRIYKPAGVRIGIPHATWHTNSTALVKRYAHLRPGFLKTA